MKGQINLEPLFKAAPNNSLQPPKGMSAGELRPAPAAYGQWEVGGAAKTSSRVGIWIVSVTRHEEGGLDRRSVI